MSSKRIEHITIIHENKDIRLITELKAFLHLVGITCTFFNKSNEWDKKQLVELSYGDILATTTSDTSFINSLNLDDLRATFNFTDTVDLIDSLHTSKCINGVEYSDLLNCYALFFREGKYEFLYWLSSNCVPYDDPYIKSDLHKRYEHTIDLCKKGGSPHLYPYYNYARVQLMFEINYFCKRHGLSYYVTNESIYKLSDELGYDDLAADILLYLIDDYKMAFDRYPRYKDTFHNETYYSLSEIMMRKFEFKEASKYIAKAIEADPMDWHSYWNAMICSESSLDRTENYYHIIDILNQKYQMNFWSIMDFEGFFNACCGAAFELAPGNPVKAFDYCMLALDAFRKNQALNLYKLFIERDDPYWDNLTRYCNFHSINLKQLQNFGIVLASKVAPQHVHDFEDL